MVPAGTKCRIAYTLLLLVAGLAPQRVIAQTQRTLLYELDVTDFDPFSEGSDWVSSTVPDLDILGELDTDTVTFDTPTLFMGSNPFQFTAPQGPMGQFNHIKHGYTYQQDLVALAGNASIIDVEGSVYCQTTGAEQHPFGDAVTDADADVRLANCVFGVVDRTQFLSFDVSITNTAVYALYWMFPFTLGQPGQENFLSFGGVKKLMDKTPEDLVSVTLRIDMAENTVTYLVDGEAGLVIDRPGMLPAADQEFSVLAVMNEGPEIEFQLGMIQPVLGLLTDLDMADPVLHQSGACGFFPAGNPTPQLPMSPFQPPPRECAVGLVPLYATEEGELLNRFPFIWMDATARNSSLLWGQGAEMWVSNLSAYQVSADIVETD